jgi:hypothetical protein
MFNDKITKKIAESAKKVLEANEEVPPVVAGRLPASALPKKKKTKKAIPVKKEAPVVRLGQGDYQKDYTEKNLGPVVDVKDIASKISKRVMGIIRPKKN